MGLPEAGTRESEDPRRLRLILHAARIFIAKGYEGASVDEIADVAGVGKATIYRLIGDKTDLLKAVMADATRHMVSACRVVLDPDQPAEQMLTRFAETYIAAMYAPFAGGLPFYQVARLMISTSFTAPDLMRDFIGAYVDAGVKPLTAYLSARAAAGELATGDAEDAIAFFQIVFYTDRAIADRDVGPPLAKIAAMARRQVLRFLYGCSSADRGWDRLKSTD